MVDAQQWLIDNYEKQKKNKTEIRVDKGTKLEGKLVINGYPELKLVFLINAEGITELEIEDCPKIEAIYASNNQITEIKGLDKLVELKKINIGVNKIEKINLSQNSNLEMINLRENPNTLEITNGIKKLSKLSNLDSYKTFPLTKILDQASEEELKEIAKNLGLDIGEKKLEDLKKDIKDEIEKINQNKKKLNDDFPNLIDKDGKVDENKSKELKHNAEKGEKYQKMVDDPSNASIVDSNSKEIDQGKLTSILEELSRLHDVDKHKDNEKILNNGKFDQDKLDGELKKSNDYNELAKNNPSLVSEDGKIDPAKIRELVDKGENLKKLEDAMKGAGIDLSNTDDAKKKIEEFNSLKLSVEDYFGKDYKERLGVNEFQNYIEVSTLKN